MVQFPHFATHSAPAKREKIPTFCHDFCIQCIVYWKKEKGPNEI